MAKIWVEPAKARATLSQQEALAKTLASLYQDVNGIRSGLRYKISGREAISARLRDAAGQISKEAESTRALRAALEQAVGLYEKTEKGNLDRVKAEKTSIQQGGSGATSSTQTGGQSDSAPKGFSWSDLVLKELATVLGPFGVLITGGQKALEGKWPEAVNELFKSIGKGASAIIGKPKAEWANSLFGLTEMTKAPSFWKGLGDFSSVGKAVGTVTKWGTTIADRLIKNVKEFGEDAWTSGRFWGETVIESGIKLAEGAAINALVGAAAVAIFGNPVSIGVTAAAVGVTMLVDWGLDSIVSWATGGAQTDWVEAATDFLIDDVGPAIKNAVDKGVEVVKDAGGKIINAVGDGVNAVKDGISNFFSGCSWGKKLFA